MPSIPVTSSTVLTGTLVFVQPRLAPVASQTVPAARATTRARTRNVRFTVTDLFAVSVQVKQQHLRWFDRRELESRFIRKRGRIATSEGFAIEFHFAFGDVHPGVATRIKRVRYSVACIEFRQIKVGVLVDGKRAITAGFTRDQV